MKRRPVFRIRESHGTYFRGMTAIGPMFGATFNNAMTFDDGMEAYRHINAFPMAVLAEMVNKDKKKCDVTGKALKENRND